MGTQTTPRRRSGTREAIQAAALARFSEQGYDKTSLREVAEDLGVTKAALYYHFRSKDEIVAALLADLTTRLADLLAWAGSQEPTRATRLELLRRLADVVAGGGGALLRCVQNNELAMATVPGASDVLHNTKRDIWRVAVPADATPADRLRARLAITAVMLAATGDDQDGPLADRVTTALEVATALMP